MIFATLYFYLHELKKCLIFLKSYFKLDILTFLSFVVSFLVDLFNYKAPFLTKKNINGEIYRSSYRKLTCHHWQKLELCKVIHNKKLHTDYWGCDFNSRKYMIFLVYLSSRYAHIPFSRFLYKNIFIL